ncbi:MAG: tryptophan-rich sensory protein [Akkermansiaceae bacterium]|jgi:tryptophan-rich sensory protein|nr:tryptophan-rich sensory protein [Akkermansiaceae bacterium]
MKFIPRLILCIVIMEILGGLGGYVTAASIADWYAPLRKPPGTPPNFVFGPVWTLLYGMIGASIALVWHHVPAGAPKRRVLFLGGMHLLLNLAWSPVFFGLHQVAAALIILCLMVITAAVMIQWLLRLQRTAGLLWMPYFLWISYATWLNAGILLLNPQLL